MAKSQATFGKKDKERNKQKQRIEKQEKMAERKANAQKGKSLDEMMAYIDENGNITSTPPDPNKKRRTIDVSEIQVSVPKQEDRPVVNNQRTGSVTFFNKEKGFGFIKDLDSDDSIFVHISQLKDAVGEGDHVTYEIGSGPKGPTANDVKKVVASVTPPPTTAE